MAERYLDLAVPPSFTEIVSTLRDLEQSINRLA